jgi:glyoxylase-like metal-dependent hydrolase (beta-lactamase superfamily II)
MYVQLEDEFGDVVGKARRGQEIDEAGLAARVGISTEDLTRIENYELIPEPPTVERLAAELGLHPGKLQDSASKQFFPLYPAGKPIEGMKVEMMILGSGFLMNGYIIGCEETGKGAVVDPGFDPEKILRSIGASGLDIELVLLTHGHQDHISALSEICQATDAPALINDGDLELMGALSNKIEGALREGQVVEVGNLKFEVRATPGHTRGGSSLVHDQVAFVGDALFAGSLGGTRSVANYEMQRQAVGDKLLQLDEKVVLYPGHGPATTVAEEKAHNPYFA